MVTERAANAIAVSGAGQQRVDLLDCSLGAAEPELEHALMHPGLEEITVESNEIETVSRSLALGVTSIRLTESG